MTYLILAALPFVALAAFIVVTEGWTALLTTITTTAVILMIAVAALYLYLTKL